MVFFDAEKLTNEKEDHELERRGTQRKGERAYSFITNFLQRLICMIRIIHRLTTTIFFETS